MAQQLQTFTRNMMVGVINDHATRTEHDGHCCTLAHEYAARLGKETPSVPAPREATKTRKAKNDDEDLFAPSGMTSETPVKWATDRQLDYILSLGRRVSINLISPKHREDLTAVRNGEAVTKTEANSLIEALKAQTDQRPREASSAQLRYLHHLVETREWNGEINFLTLSSSKASDLINELKDLPLKKGAKKRDTKPASDSTLWPDEGFYYIEATGTYFKVQDAKAEGGQRYAKRWFPEAEKWVYDGQRNFRHLKPETKLTAEQASKFGELYGKCIALGCELTNEVSIHWGYGEKCAANNGWPYHTDY